MLNWNYTKAEARIIARIAKRAAASLEVEYQDTEMDVAAVHCNGCPLDLPKLLEFDDFNFAHDIIGIRRHLDRETGELKNHFLPRCAGRAVTVEA